MSTLPDITSLDAGLPAAIDAERTLLGAVLLDNSAWQDIVAKLRPADFSLDTHQRIGRAMKRLTDASSPIDIITLAHELGRVKEIEAVGGVSYLASLTEGLPLRPAIEDYIRIVKDKSVLRQMMVLCSNAISRAQEQEESPLEILSDVASAVEKMTEPMQDSKQSAVKDFLPDVAMRDNEEYVSRTVPCIPTGNSWLDAKMGGGYRMGKYTIVAARPKIGKSAFKQTSIAYNCQRGLKCVDFSLEMSQDEVMKNLVPYVVNLRNVVVARPSLRTPEQHGLVAQAWEILLDWPLKIYDGEMDIDQVCWCIDRETRNGESVLFSLDHFGLLQGAGKDIRTRYVENSTRLRKKIAQKKNCALMNLFQLNPVPREFADKRPQPEDLKESKNPLEDCFAAIFLHRYVDKESLKITKKANINLPLIRGGGSPGNVDCDFETRNLEFMAHAELSLEED